MIFLYSCVSSRDMRSLRLYENKYWAGGWGRSLQSSCQCLCFLFPCFNAFVQRCLGTSYSKEIFKGPCADVKFLFVSFTIRWWRISLKRKQGKSLVGKSWLETYCCWVVSYWLYDLLQLSKLLIFAALWDVSLSLAQLNNFRSFYQFFFSENIPIIYFMYCSLFDIEQYVTIIWTVACSILFLVLSLVYEQES